MFAGMGGTDERDQDVEAGMGHQVDVKEPCTIPVYVILPKLKWRDSTNWGCWVHVCPILSKINHSVIFAQNERCQEIEG